jgi:hypothetical protein
MATETSNMTAKQCDKADALRLACLERRSKDVGVSRRSAQSKNCTNVLRLNGRFTNSRKHATRVTGFVVEWLTLLPDIPEVPGSDLFPTTGYPDRVFVVSLQAHSVIVPKIRPRPPPSTSSPIHHSRITP